MKSPIQEKLDQFRRLWRRQVLEFALETVFLTTGSFFLAAELLDYGLWRWYFVELPGLRKFLFLALILVWVWEIYLFRHAISRIPRSRQETLHHLRIMKRRSHPSLLPASSLSEKKTLGKNSISNQAAPPEDPETGSPKRPTQNVSKILPGEEEAERLFLPENLENALDFLENPQPAASWELACAAIAQAEREMTHFHPHAWMNLCPIRQFRWVLRFAVLVLTLTLGIFGGMCSENTSAAVQRFLPPWKANWQLDFSPQWKTIPEEVLFGETFDAEILLQSPAPFILVHLWENADSSEPFRTLRISPFLGRYLVRIPNIQRPFHISLGMPMEAPQNTYRYSIRLSTRPSLTNALLRIQAPSALRQPPKETGWEISGLAGSRVGLMIAADRPLKEAKIRFTNGTYVPGEPAGKNEVSRTFKFRFELLRECGYFLELTDMNGIQSRLETHTIRVLEDEPPAARWGNSAPGRLILPGARLRLSLEGQDDFGLASLGFRWVAESPVQIGISPGSGTPVSPSMLPTKDGFLAPSTQDGTLKWVGQTVWDVDSNEETAKAESQTLPLPTSSQTEAGPLPLFYRTDSAWDLSSIALTPGMRLRAEPLAADANRHWEAGPALLFHIVSPEEMQRQTFRRWISITQELRQIGNHLKACREMISAGLTPETASDAAGKLTQTMNLTQRLLNAELGDSLPQQITLLERDLEENPPFPFHENLTSRDQLSVLRELSIGLDQLLGQPLSALNQEIVQFAKILRFPENARSVEQLRTFEDRLAQKLDAVLEILAPQMRSWDREEYFDVMRSDFLKIQDSHEQILQELTPLLQLAGELSPMELRMRDEELLRSSEIGLWNLNRDLKRFLFRFGEMLDLLSEPQKNAKVSAWKLSSEDTAKNAGHSPLHAFTHLPPEAHQILQLQESTLLSLKADRFWDFQKQTLALHSALHKAAFRWFHTESSNPAREELMIFVQMQRSQEKILQLLETCLKPERTLKENKTVLVPLTRNLRMSFRDCAELQAAFSRHFSGTEPKSPSLPRALTPLWEPLCEDLLLSIEEFRVISRNDTPPLEILEDQFTLQLQIFDQLAELAIIAEGMPKEVGDWARNADFENRLETAKEEANAAPSASADPNAKKVSSADENDTAGSEEKSNGSPGQTVEPADIQVLIAMQESVYAQTKELTETQKLSPQERAAEVDFQTGQERKIAASAELLGFGTRPNSSFDTILAQIYQVVFLLEKQDLGPMTFSIQEEILYGLRAALHRKEIPEESETSVSRTEKMTEDLSQTTDSRHSADEMANEQEGEKEEAPAPNRPETENEDALSKKGDLPNEEEEIRTRDTMNRVLDELQNSYWGELPSRQKEELKLIPQAEPIPGYQKMLEHYYQNLRK